MKKILILGGGINQIPLIKAAIEEKYSVVLCDANEKCLGRDLCDKFYKISIDDYDEVLNVCIKEKVNGIVANTEAIMSKVASITSKLNLVGNSQEVIDLITNKRAFREFQNKNGFFCPKCIEVYDLNDLPLKINDFSFPIVMKPSKCSGSRGVSVIQNYNEETIKKSFENARNFSRNNKVILEEFVDTNSLDEVEAELFVNDGEILWDGLLLTTKNEKHPVIPVTDIYPLPYTKGQIDYIKCELSRMFDLLNVRHGEYNVELYFTPNNELFVLEINARQGGSFMPYYCGLSSGIDYYKLFVTTAVGDNFYWNEIKKHHKKRRYITNHPVYSDVGGKFCELDIDDEIKTFIIDIKLRVNDGYEIRQAKNESDHIGYVVFEFPNQSLQLKYSRILDNFIHIKFYK